LEPLGLRLNPTRNEALRNGKRGQFSDDASALKAYVIPTNEELLIARDAFRVVTNAPRRW
jgi:acetate kinase